MHRMNYVRWMRRILPAISVRADVRIYWQQEYF